jgi:hypothetical protein
MSLCMCWLATQVVFTPRGRFVAGNMRIQRKNGDCSNSLERTSTFHCYLADNFVGKGLESIPLKIGMISTNQKQTMTCNDFSTITCSTEIMGVPKHLRYACRCCATMILRFHFEQKMNFPPRRTRYEMFYLDSSRELLSRSRLTKESLLSYQSDSWDDDGAHFTYTFDKYT